jgi:hypothetical protein
MSLGETPMSDLSYLLMPRNYPEAFALFRDSFAPQPDMQTCGAAALRHGLLLGGLLAPVHVLESLLGIRDNEETDYKTLLKALDYLGFETEPEPREKPKKQSTAAFLDELRPELDRGAFLLPCLYGGTHWVCLGAWDGKRAWVVDSYHGKDWYWTPRGLPPSLGFFGYTEQEFDEQDWEDCINVVRPGKWTKQYQDWLPARRALLRMTAQDDPTGPVSMEAAVAMAANQYLDHAEYSYRKLGLYLPDGVEVTVTVEDPGEDAVLVREEGVGEDRVLVVRRAKGAARGRTPPELVLRAGQLRAAQLDSR